MDKTWFANKGQIMQLVVPTISLCLSASDKVHFAAFPYTSIALATCAATSVFMIVREHRATRKAADASAKAPVDPYTDPRTMGARIIRDDFGYLLEHYRRLDFDAREKVRLPLNPASWPGFGEKWDYPQAQLFSLHIMMNWSLLKAKVVWKEMGWPESVSRLFRCGESTVMVDVLVGLQESIDWLKQQIEKPTGPA